MTTNDFTGKQKLPFDFLGFALFCFCVSGVGNFGLT